MKIFLIFVTGLVLVQQAIAVVPTPRCRRQYEVYNSCGSACPITCNNYLNYDQIMCTEQCVAGCYCAKGYVRNTADGSCCRPTQCPGAQPVCPLHEKYNTCGTACPLTCANYNNPPMFCTANCVVRCQCETGCVRNQANGSCCLSSECP